VPKEEVYTPDGTQPDREATFKRLMQLLHERYPGLDYLMLQTVVDHYLDFPDDGPEEVIRKGQERIPEYFMRPESEEEGPRVTFQHDPYYAPQEPPREVASATIWEEEEQDVDDAHSPVSSGVSRGTQTNGEGPERTGEQQPESDGELRLP